MSQTPPPNAPEVCHVGLVFALGIESGGLVDRLAGVITTRGADFTAREGGLAGRRVVVIESGAGQAAATRATELLLAGHRPRWIISAGFAGGLDPRLGKGDILLPDRVCRTTGQELMIDFRLDPTTLAADPRLHVGRLVTVDHVISSSDEKRALGSKHQALAVDMESLAVAEVCRQAKVRFLAVRVISDPVDQKLPAEIDNLVRQKTRAGRFGAVAGALFRRPSSIKDLWQLKESALVASERLGQFLTGIIAQLD